MDLHKIAQRICFSTDRSLAENIREALLPKILELFPSGYFEDKLYDTSEGGKGYKSGYVSFGLKPMAWANKGLIGGILIRGVYSPKVIKSKSPETNTPEWSDWEKSGGNPDLEGGETEVMELKAGYYNKTKGGAVSRVQDLGEVLFSISKMETVEEVDIGNASNIISSIEEIVNDVLQDPPEEAVSKNKSVIKKNSPYSSLKKFLHYLMDEGRRSFRPDEVKAITQFTDKNEREIVEWLRKRGLTYDSDVKKAASLYPSWD